MKTLVVKITLVVCIVALSFAFMYVTSLYPTLAVVGFYILVTTLCVCALAYVITDAWSAIKDLKE